MFSPIESIRKEVMLQITNSLTQLQLGQPGPSIVPRVSQETQTDDTEANSGGNQESRQSKVQSSQPRRQLRSSLNHSHPSILLNGPQSSVVPSGSDILRQPKEYLLNRVDLVDGEEKNHFWTNENCVLVGLIFALKLSQSVQRTVTLYVRKRSNKGPFSLYYIQLFARIKDAIVFLGAIRIE
ncbi:uncharacterized protein LOC129763491 isoform X1 [Toxorhynchites rutilus septentrionalis]|uniref:uncharacterized protein LOC129763491 isoform X1 n=1 Tax=Toxorhynchites rutilus septentrionalis TaxID=329112 RepID=UPI00247ABB37|nr:uncharacterized protein LOC129763491 isoform X1 [Toxorhynchites rutilus septentrionalis]